ncbi:hypothetical protein EN943_00100 [Mesorhizobium sp. M7A.F.Ca.US.006.01.1.1]|nr:hypothetical protein EN943_00100 [Mesorhizobium sp. M7A.F.Ca.US.006.01.1.1]
MARPHRFVILWRSKERSDAAQTIGSMPGLLSVATVQNSAPLRPTTEVAAWILGSPRRSFAPASPVDDEVGKASPPRIKSYQRRQLLHPPKLPSRVGCV